MTWKLSKHIVSRNSKAYRTFNWNPFFRGVLKSIWMVGSRYEQFAAVTCFIFIKQTNLSRHPGSGAVEFMNLQSNVEIHLSVNFLLNKDLCQWWFSHGIISFSFCRIKKNIEYHLNIVHLQYSHPLHLAYPLVPLVILLMHANIFVCFSRRKKKALNLGP